MKKIELLSPAGNMEALKAAVHNGADAVYLSGMNYGARAYAKNFTNEELTKATMYAHLYDVKVYVTVNTLIYENEINDAINYLKFLYEIGVDAVIMQDIGLITLTRKLIPDLEIHASTQTHNCNDETLKLFKELGVARVVLARELSLDEINNLKTDIEKEIFVYGALCICYSGCCLMSSYLGGRSGNRGKCAGPCRLPYTLIMDNKEIKTDGNFLLSTRELNTLEKLPLILNSNIQSIKIEGRMKSPEYVGYVTKIFRSFIDNKKVDNYEMNLKKLFNRKFTTGHLFKDQIINNKTPNHQGIKIGNIISSNKFIKIKLTEDLRQNDGIRFMPSNTGMIVNKLYNKDYKLINKAFKGDIIYLENKHNIKKDNILLKTYDYDLSNEIKNYPLKQLFINYKVVALKNKPLVITMTHNNLTSTYTGNIVSTAKTSPITKENIISHLSKLGNTPFKAKKIELNIDNNIFIPVKCLNTAKRFLVQEIINKKTTSNKHITVNLSKKEVRHSKKISISAFISNEKQLNYLLDKVDRIYTSDYNLYKKYKCSKLYFRVNRTNYHLPNYTHENLLVTELGSVFKYAKNNNVITDYTLNVTNSYSAGALKNKNVNIVNLSAECNDDNLKELLKYTSDIELIIYGRLELMVINYCLIKNNVGCKFCKHKFALKNKDNLYFPVLNNNCKNIILSPKPINKINKILEYFKYGINNFRIDFYDESITEIQDILNTIKAKTQ